MKISLVGGFLGSGKTTAIAMAGKMLLGKKVSIAVITNDQGEQLVDSAFIDSLHIPNSEVSNGCFCCNYGQFYSAIENLNASIHHDLIFAEAVGSCTDLVATIINPMLRSDPETNMVLSVFTDGTALLASLEGRSSFISDNIRYIYKKQLEEADILIINKSDRLTGGEMGKIRLMLESEYPGKELLFQDSTNESSIEKWLDAINKRSTNKKLKSLDIDYGKYAKGEAALAWLDSCINIHSKRKAIQKGFEWIEEIRDLMYVRKLPIGHMKFFLQSGDWQQKISYTQDNVINKGDRNNDFPADHVSVLVNIRVETSPDQLKQIFFQAVAKKQEQDCHIEVLNLASFQPGYPKPTYRLAE